MGYRRHIVDSPSGTVEQVVIPVDIPEQKNWWRNFTGNGAALWLHLPEGARTGQARAIRGHWGRVRVLVHLDPVGPAGPEIG